MFGPSLMDYCNQGTLPSYEESCDLPEEGGGGTALTRGTTVVMESVYPSLGEAPSQEEVPVVSKETSGGDNNEAGLLDEDKNDKAKGIGNLNFIVILVTFTNTRKYALKCHCMYMYTQYILHR